MFNPIPYILTLLTGKLREKVEIKWSNKSWTHNVFRFWELIAWRKIGIRPELSSVVIIEKGKPQRVYYVFHSWESVFAYTESAIREFFQKFEIKLPVKILLSQPVGMQGMLPSGFLFAIAHDADSTSITNGFSGTATTTWSHVVTGTNPLLVGCFNLWQDIAGTGTITAASYNSVAETKVDAQTTGGMRAELWYLKAPATGTNTQSTTLTGNHDAKKYAMTSFTGVDQSSPLDVSNKATGSTGNPSVSVTTTVANTVLVATLCRFSTTAATSSQTSVFNSTTGSILGAASYQIVSSTGSKTDTYTGSASQDWAMVIGAFKQAAAAVTSSFLGLLSRRRR